MGLRNDCHTRAPVNDNYVKVVGSENLKDGCSGYRTLVACIISHRVQLPARGAVGRRSADHMGMILLGGRIRLTLGLKVFQPLHSGL